MTDSNAEARCRLTAARDLIAHVLNGTAELDDVAPGIVALVGRALEYGYEAA